MNPKILIPLVITIAALAGAFYLFKNLPSKIDSTSNSNLSMAKVIIEDLKIGTGPEAVNGKNVTVHYTGWLKDGKKFDSSVDRKKPFSFLLGSGQVIRGWDQGVLGMKTSGKRKLTIPAELGYGEHGAAGIIPPNAELVFEVELLKVE